MYLCEFKTGDIQQKDLKFRIVVTGAGMGKGQGLVNRRGLGGTSGVLDRSYF